jgi:hypothetical protein
MMRRGFLALLVAAAAGLAACATDAVILRHSSTGRTVRCGPFPTFPQGTAQAYQKERDCVADYQRQGYERVPQ